MAGKSAAVKTDVDAVPSKTDPEEADPGSGSWSDGEISAAWCAPPIRKLRSLLPP